MTTPTKIPANSACQREKEKSQSEKRESARRIYIRILEHVGEDTEIQIMYELIEGGYAKGIFTEDHEGKPHGALISHITPKGRLFLQQLREEEYKLTSEYKLKMAFIFIGGIAVSNISNIIEALVK